MSPKTSIKDTKEEAIRISYTSLKLHFNERTSRIWAATEANRYGYGGVSCVHRATGISRKTIRKEIKELKSDKQLVKGKLRRSGGGRKSLTITNPEALAALEEELESSTRGDPESLLLWTNKSTYTLAEALAKKGHKISQTKIYKTLEEKKYSMQSNRKVLEGTQHPNRDEQFKYINQQAKKNQEQQCPVLSIDTKKKENIGNYKNNGKEYRPQGKPTKVNTHDFINKELGKVAPYGVYDIGKNEGWVNVGISSDTAEFAANSIRTWWYNMGEATYKNASSIMITADCGGSNNYKNRLWKMQLQKLANELNKEFHVCHFPPGTSKWNKIEHRMFSYISINWRGRPLISRETVVNLIGNTTTKTGLKIMAALDENQYLTGIKISDEELSALNIERNEFQGEWNYIIKPQIK